MCGEREVDEIFTALSHGVRREIIRVLGSRGSRSFTELMNDVGVSDSSTLAFHLRRLRRLVRKNERGEYELTELGVRAYEVLKQVGLVAVREEQAAPPPPRREGRGEELHITGLLCFTLSRDMMEKLYSEGRRVSVSNVIKLIIEEVPRDVFDEVVGSISNVVLVYAPRGLEDLVYAKARRVVVVKTYVGEPPKPESKGLTSAFKATALTVPLVVESLMSTIASAMSGLGASGGKEVYEELKIPESVRLEVSCEGDSRVMIIPGERAYVKAKANDVSLDVNESMGLAKLTVESGNVEVGIPDDRRLSLVVHTDSGVSNVTVRPRCSVDYVEAFLESGIHRLELLGVTPRHVMVDVDGSTAQCYVELGSMREDCRLSVSLDSGMLTVNVKAPKGVGIRVRKEVYDGYAYAEVDGRPISAEYEEAGTPTLKLDVCVVDGVARVTVERDTVE